MGRSGGITAWLQRPDGTKLKTDSNPQGEHLPSFRGSFDRRFIAAIPGTSIEAVVKLGPPGFNTYSASGVSIEILIGGLSPQLQCDGYKQTFFIPKAHIATNMQQKFTFIVAWEKVGQFNPSVFAPLVMPEPTAESVPESADLLEDGECHIVPGSLVIRVQRGSLISNDASGPGKQKHNILLPPDKLRGVTTDGPRAIQPHWFRPLLKSNGFPIVFEFVNREHRTLRPSPSTDENDTSRPNRPSRIASSHCASSEDDSEDSSQSRVEAWSEEEYLDSEDFSAFVDHRPSQRRSTMNSRRNSSIPRAPCIMPVFHRSPSVPKQLETQNDDQNILTPRNIHNVERERSTVYADSPTPLESRRLDSSLTIGWSDADLSRTFGRSMFLNEAEGQDTPRAGRRVACSQRSQYFSALGDLAEPFEMGGETALPADEYERQCESQIRGELEQALLTRHDGFAAQDAMEDVQMDYKEDPKYQEDVANVERLYGLQMANIAAMRRAQERKRSAQDTEQGTQLMCP